MNTNTTTNINKTHTLRSAFKRWLELHNETYRTNNSMRIPHWFRHYIRKHTNWKYTNNYGQETYDRRGSGFYTFAISDIELLNLQRPTINPSKQYYVQKWQDFWSECRQQAKTEIETNNNTTTDISDIATQIFEETANAEQIAGYYIIYHEANALHDWLCNTKDIKMTEQDYQITAILKTLYPDSY